MQRINDFMWCEEDGLYYDLDRNGNHLRFRTAACFLPMTAGIPDDERARQLVANLTDASTFWTRVPVPSMASSEADYEKDMWRGPTWININYLIVDGLRRYGHADVAREIVDRTMAETARWYERTGCIMEYYDCEGVEDPRRMLRKGSRTEGIRVIRDYGWSAALFVAFAHERHASAEVGERFPRKKTDLYCRHSPKG